MDASLKWQFDTPLWHIDAVGGRPPDHRNPNVLDAKAHESLLLGLAQEK
jgi:hypothetical protein